MFGSRPSEGRGEHASTAVSDKNGQDDPSDDEEDVDPHDLPFADDESDHVNLLSSDDEEEIDPDDAPFVLTEKQVRRCNVMVVEPWLGPRPIGAIRQRPTA